MFRGRTWWLFRVIHEYRWLIREACEERGGKIEKERLSQGALVEELELKQDMHLVWKSYCQSERIATWCSTTCQTQITQWPIWSEFVSANIPDLSSGLEFSRCFLYPGVLPRNLMYYRRMTGTGPKEGWVQLVRPNGIKPLLIKSELRPPPRKAGDRHFQSTMWHTSSYNIMIH